MQTRVYANTINASNDNLERNVTSDPIKEPTAKHEVGKWSGPTGDIHCIIEWILKIFLILHSKELVMSFRVFQTS